jgi:hypothetical protein
MLSIHWRFAMKPRGYSVADDQTGPEQHYRKVISTGAVYVIYNGTNTIAKFSDSLAGYDIPDFHKRKRAGELLPYTPYSRFTIKGSWSASYYRKQPPYTYHTDQNWQNGVTAGIAVPWYVSTSDISGVLSEIDLRPYVQMAAASIYSSGFDALTFLAEFHKVVAMFRNIDDRLRKLLRDRDIASSWLEYRYGWRILFYDLVSLSNAIANLNDDRKRRSQRSGTSTYSDVVTNYSFSDGNTGFTGVNQDRTEISVRGSVTADIIPPNIQFNPLVTTWELVKYSFIIDWFVNIGQAISALSFLALQTNYVAAGGVKVTFTRSRNMTSSYAVSGSVTEVSHAMTSSCSLSYLARSPMRVSMQPFVNPKALDVSKILDTLALIYGETKHTKVGKRIRRGIARL